MMKPYRHLRAGDSGIARWNTRCTHESVWLSYPSSVALTDNKEEVTCPDCRELLGLHRTKKES